MNLNDHNNKKIRVTLKDGSFFEGFATYNVREYHEVEFGIDEEGLQIGDYLIRASEIERVDRIEADAFSTRTVEEDLAMTFCVKRSFSENLVRWEDNELPDKYDHNAFEYSAQPSKEEFKKALELQKERGDKFIKLEGDLPLENDFGLKASVTLTMVLKGGAEDWAMNEDILVKEPKLKELEELELRNFGKIYGEDFSVRNLRHTFEQLEYRGAYLNDKLVGAYFFFPSNGFTCVDGLVVDEGSRNKKIATTLLKYAVSEAAGNIVFLHADEDDTPKEMYKKMGFVETDRLYEYLCDDISKISK